MGDNVAREGTELATLGGGCFWCLEAAFADLRGVLHVEAGYSGGSRRDPTYEEVCTGRTGHAEVVQITFDPSTIAYRDLLNVYFSIHDPTTPNRQGADVGSQYRSVIFHHTPEQERDASRAISELETGRVWKNPIVTEIRPFESFSKAEEYHQKYYRKQSGRPYCRAVIGPKLALLRRKHADLLRPPRA